VVIKPYERMISCPQRIYHRLTSDIIGSVHYLIISCVFSRLRAIPCPAPEDAVKVKNEKRLECKSGHRPCNTEAHAEIRISGQAVIAKRYPHERCIVVPATATQHPARTAVVIWIRLCRTGVTSIPV